MSRDENKDSTDTLPVVKMEGGNLFKFHMRRTFNSKGADFRKVAPETIAEFLARGGKIEKIPQPLLKNIWGDLVRRELFEE